MRLNEVKKLTALNAIAGVGTDRFKIDIPNRPQVTKREVPDAEGQPKILSDFSIGQYRLFSVNKLAKIGWVKRYTNLEIPGNASELFKKISENTGIPEENIALSKLSGGSHFYFRIGDLTYNLVLSPGRSETGRRQYDISFNTVEKYYGDTGENVPDDALAGIATFSAWFAKRNPSAIFTFTGITSKGINQRISVYYNLLKKNNVKNMYVKRDRYSPTGHNAAIYFSVTPIESDEYIPVTPQIIKAIRGETEPRPSKKQIKELNKLISKVDPGFEIKEQPENKESVIPLDTFKKTLEFYQSGKYENEDINNNLYSRPQISYLKSTEKADEIRRSRTDNYDYGDEEEEDYDIDMEIDSAVSELQNALDRYIQMEEQSLQPEELMNRFEGEQSDEAQSLATLYGMDVDELVDFAIDNNVTTDIEYDYPGSDYLIIEEGMDGGEREVDIDELVRISDIDTDIWERYEDVIATNAQLPSYVNIRMAYAYEVASLEDVQDELQEQEVEIDYSNLDRDNLRFYLNKNLYDYSSEQIKNLIEAIKQKKDRDFWLSVSDEQLEEIATGQQYQLPFAESLTESQKRIIDLINEA